MSDQIVGCWLTEIGYPEYYLYINNTLLNTRTGYLYYPDKQNHFTLYQNGVWPNARKRISSRKLFSLMFESPRKRYGIEWANLSMLGFPNYEITHLGELYSLVNGCYLTGHLNSEGYVKVQIVNYAGLTSAISIHRLVASAFIPNPEQKPEVNHIDGNKTNNHVSNLEFVWGWENVQHARENGLRSSVLSDEQIHKICKLLESGERVSSIMRILEVPKHAVLGIKSGCHYRISQFYNIPRNKHF